jgi:hypothetical protein
VSEPVAPREASDAHLRVLRAAVKLRMDRTSARVVAREVGVTQGTVYNFVAARVRPYGTTLARMETWYRNAVLSGGLPVGRDGVRYVLEPWLAGAPDHLRPAMADELAALLVEMYARRELEIPMWLSAFSHGASGAPRAVQRPTEAGQLLHRGLSGG